MLRAKVIVNVSTDEMPSDFIDINLHVKNVSRNIFLGETERFINQIKTGVELGMGQLGKVSRIEWGGTENNIIFIEFYWE